MKRFFKISVILIFPLVLVVGLVLLGLWISSLGTPPLMSYDFLKNRTVVARREHDPRKSPFSSIHDYYSWVQWYSFQADFNDVCKAADAELLTLGFTTRTHSIERRKVRLYTLNTLSRTASIKTVVIHERRRLVKSPIGEGYILEFADGWIAVKIERGQIPSWPPRYLLYRLKRRFRR